MTEKEIADINKKIDIISVFPSKISSLRSKIFQIMSELRTAMSNIEAGVVLFYTPYGSEELNNYYNKLSTLHTQLYYFYGNCNALISYYKGLLPKE